MESGTINIFSLTTVGLTVQDAEKFKLFCQYYNQFSYLLESGMFERVRPGSVVLHLNKSGEIGKIELHPVIVLINELKRSNQNN